MILRVYINNLLITFYNFPQHKNNMIFYIGKNLIYSEILENKFSHNRYKVISVVNFGTSYILFNTYSENCLLKTRYLHLYIYVLNIQPN